jgi:putative ABC transport system permease protein
MASGSEISTSRPPPSRLRARTVPSCASIASVTQALNALLRKRRNISEGESDNFNVFDTKQISETLAGTIRVITLLLGAVAAISLLVGGIGIMNIMLVSVTERTREIGIRLAIGALEREVLLQFLVEAMALAAFGGVIGVILANLASVGLAHLTQIPFIFNLRINLASFVFSGLIGIVFDTSPPAARHSSTRSRHCATSEDRATGFPTLESRQRR